MLPVAKFAKFNFNGIIIVLYCFNLEFTIDIRVVTGLYKGVTMKSRRMSRGYGVENASLIELQVRCVI